MITLNSELDAKLDAIWYRLQRWVEKNSTRALSQKDASEACVRALDVLITRLEETDKGTK